MAEVGADLGRLVARSHRVGSMEPEEQMQAEPVVPSVGWGVLHLFCRVTQSADREAVTSALKAAAAEEVQVVTVALLGHKGDIGFMVLGPDLWKLRRFQGQVTSAGLQIVASYVSLTEISEYAAGMPPEKTAPRLYPVLPPEGKPAFCFYPMSRRRDVGQNWWSLPFEKRNELMFGHGRTGRGFAGRVIQVVTGSSGIDDWEWGVTLFATKPDDLKDVVYTMRYDEASALYADFGPFYTGLVAPPDQVWDGLGIQTP